MRTFETLSLPALIASVGPIHSALLAESMKNRYRDEDAIAGVADVLLAIEGRIDELVAERFNVEPGVATQFRIDNGTAGVRCAIEYGALVGWRERLRAGNE